MSQFCKVVIDYRLDLSGNFDHFRFEPQISLISDFFVWLGLRVLNSFFPNLNRFQSYPRKSQNKPKWKSTLDMKEKRGWRFVNDSRKSTVWFVDWLPWLRWELWYKPRNVLSFKTTINNPSGLIQNSRNVCKCCSCLILSYEHE